LYWSAETFRIFECKADQPTVELVLERTHPEDRERVLQTIDRAARERERLSFPSSGEWLPWSSISQNSVKDCDQLAGHGNESEELGFASGDEPVAEPFELRLVACCDHGSNEQRTAHALAAAATETLTTRI